MAVCLLKSIHPCVSVEMGHVESVKARRKICKIDEQEMKRAVCYLLQSVCVISLLYYFIYSVRIGLQHLNECYQSYTSLYWICVFI